MKKTTLLSILLACGAFSHVQSAPIIWTVGNITNDADISTNGTAVRAYNFGNTTQTINGVTFVNATVSAGANGSVTVGGTNEGAINFSGSATAWSTNNSAFGGGASNPYASLSSSYQGMLTGGTSNGAATGGNFTLLNLTVGQEYEIQFWANDSRNIASVWTRTTTLTAGNSATMDYNVQNAGGGLGQYATGVFTADSASQVINATGSSFAQVNGYQIRAIPEPSTVAMLGILAPGLLLLINRRRKSHIYSDVHRNS